MTGFSDVLEKEEVAVRTDDGDHDLFAHYAKKKDIGEALVNGTPCTALCGKTWVPSKDVTKYPVCPECKQILDTYWPEA